MGNRIQSLERQIQELKREVEKTQRKAEEAAREAKAEDRALTKWHLAGYTAAGFTATDSDTEAVDNTFEDVQFNPIFHFQYRDLVLFEGELEFEAASTGETEVELEYSDINVFLHDYVTLQVGKFLSPIGVFQEDLHPAWINKLPDRPAGFTGGGPEPLSDVGVQLRGAIPIRSTTLTYAFAAGNGPRAEPDEIELEGFGKDNDDDKSLGGRISFLPFPWLEVGASYLTADVEGEEAASGIVTEGAFDLWGADFAFTKGAFDIRGEYIESRLGSFFGLAEEGDPTTSLIPRTKWEAWYVQAAYQLSGLTNVWPFRKLEPVIRYSSVDARGFANFVAAAEEEQRLTGGLNYLFTPSLIGKLAVESRDFRDPAMDDAIEFRAQLAYGF